MSLPDNNQQQSNQFPVLPVAGLGIGAIVGALKARGRGAKEIFLGTLYGAFNGLIIGTVAETFIPKNWKDKVAEGIRLNGSDEPVKLVKNYPDELDDPVRTLVDPITVAPSGQVVDGIENSNSNMFGSIQSYLNNDRRDTPFIKIQKELRQAERDAELAASQAVTGIEGTLAEPKQPVASPTMPAVSESSAIQMQTSSTEPVTTESKPTTAVLSAPITAKRTLPLVTQFIADNHDQYVKLKDQVKESGSVVPVDFTSKIYSLLEHQQKKGEPLAIPETDIEFQAVLKAQLEEALRAQQNQSEKPTLGPNTARVNAETITQEVTR